MRWWRGAKLASLTHLVGAEEHGGEDGCIIRSILLLGYIRQRISFLLSLYKRAHPYL